MVGNRLLLLLNRKRWIVERQAKSFKLFIYKYQSLSFAAVSSYFHFKNACNSNIAVAMTKQQNMCADIHPQASE